MGIVYSEEEAQHAIREVALMLLRLLERLEEIAECLPRPPDMDAMLEGRLPMALGVDLLGSIECATDDGLRPAIAALEKAAKVTTEDLRREFLAMAQKECRQ